MTFMAWLQMRGSLTFWTCWLLHSCQVLLQFLWSFDASVARFQLSVMDYELTFHLTVYFPTAVLAQRDFFIFFSIFFFLSKNVRVLQSPCRYSSPSLQTSPPLQSFLRWAFSWVMHHLVGRGKKKRKIKEKNLDKSGEILGSVCLRTNLIKGANSFR